MVSRKPEERQRRVWQKLTAYAWAFETESVLVKVERLREDAEDWRCSTSPDVGMGEKRLQCRSAEAAKEQALDEVGRHLDRLAAELRIPSPHEPLHVDDFVDDYRSPPYARWMLMHMRLPAGLKMAARPFIKQHRLFCTYRGKRYRVVLASRMGDVGLSEQFDDETGYKLRVTVTDCSEWSDQP